MNKLNEFLSRYNSIIGTIGVIVGIIGVIIGTVGFINITKAKNIVSEMKTEFGYNQQADNIYNTGIGPEFAEYIANEQIEKAIGINDLNEILQDSRYHIPITWSGTRDE